MDLFQAEYERNPTVNSTHPAHRLETALISFMTDKGYMQEFLEYADSFKVK